MYCPLWKMQVVGRQLRCFGTWTSPKLRPRTKHINVCYHENLSNCNQTSNYRHCHQGITSESFRTTSKSDSWLITPSPSWEWVVNFRATASSLIKLFQPSVRPSTFGLIDLRISASNFHTMPSTLLYLRVAYKNRVFPYFTEIDPLNLPFRLIKTKLTNLSKAQLQSTLGTHKPMTLLQNITHHWLQQWGGGLRSNC